MDDLGVPRGGEFNWDDAEGLTGLSRECLALRLESFRKEGRALDYRRQLVRGRIDLVLAELAGRDTAVLPPEELARVLIGEIPTRGVSRDTVTDAARDLP